MVQKVSQNIIFFLQFKNKGILISTQVWIDLIGQIQNFFIFYLLAKSELCVNYVN